MNIAILMVFSLARVLTRSLCWLISVNMSGQTSSSGALVQLGGDAPVFLRSWGDDWPHGHLLLDGKIAGSLCTRPGKRLHFANLKMAIDS